MSAVASPGAIDPASDDIKPNAIDDLVAKARGKSGSVILTWTTPGDDYANNGRAAYFDLRFAEIPIVESGGDGSSAVNFNAIPLNPVTTIQPLRGQATGEPHPDFGGHIQTFEVTKLPQLDEVFHVGVGERQPRG